MIDPEGGDSARSQHIRLQHVGRIEPPAEAHFDDACIRWNAREHEERRSYRHFEEAGRQTFARVQDLGQQRREQIVLDQLSRQPDPLIVSHQMRTGRDMHPLSVGLQHGAQERAGGALAIGACHMKHRRQSPMRIAEPVQKRADRLQPQPPLGQRQRRQPVQLLLHPGVIGPGEIAHRVD